MRDISAQVMANASWIISVLTVLGLPHVRGCGSPDSPVVIMCYNNTANFNAIGFTTSGKRVQGVGSCTCLLSTNGTDVTIKSQIMASVAPRCASNKVILKGEGPFLTTVSCRRPQSSRFKISGKASLTQTLEQRSDAPVCMKYTVIPDDDVFSADKMVTISCSGKNLPTPTTTAAQRTTSITTPITTWSTKTVTSQPSMTLQPTEGVTRTTSFSNKHSTISTKPTAAVQKTSVSGNRTQCQSVLVTTENFATTTKAKSTVSEEITNTAERTETKVKTSSLGTTKTPTEKDESDNKKLGGIIAGSVIGAIVFLILVVFVAVCLMKRRKRNLDHLTDKRVLNVPVVSDDNPAHVTQEETTAVATQNSASPASDTNAQNGLKNGKPEKPVQESRVDTDAGVLYATFDKNKLHKADTLF